MNPTYFAQYNDSYRMMEGNGWGWGMLMMFIMFVATIIVISLVLRGVHWHAPSGMNHEAALDIAKKRYAKGEITKDEFKQLTDDIK